MEGDGRMDWKMLLAYITGSVDQELSCGTSTW